MPSAHDALTDWRNLRKKVEQEGGQQYEKPVLVRFADRGTFEVMDRDIVEDEFYVRRPFKVVRELDPTGKDLEQAVRESRSDGRPQPQSQRRGGPSGRGPKPGPRPGQKPGQKQGQKPGADGKPSQRGSRRGGRSRRGSRRGGKPQGGPPATGPAPGI